MDSTHLPTPPQSSSDIFSLSDQVLSDSLHFSEEIGFGNWGSVWLCRPKPSPDGLKNVPDQKIAVKLVHRSKTSTTAARVRSLWNEMKIIRTFKSDPHPSIIPFHSFIITPSYALITMAYLPTLVPVEVDETKARDWFRFLLSGVDFLHRRGVVHNDIKPANILLSTKNIPVLVDFGFAEKYDVKSNTAFHSNLSYGTPEYLSPERARGLPHDTRKADIWSLGITFFEILMGRTPFEHSDGEQFTSKDDLEKYWSRTLRGKWVGSWKMSKGMERMLRRMIAPNADLRYTAPEAMADPFWDYRKASVTAHRRSSSYTSSVVFEKDLSKLMNETAPRHLNEMPQSPPGLSTVEGKPPKERLPAPLLTKVKSQAKVVAANVQPRKRGVVSPLLDLSPIKALSIASPIASAAGKENVMSVDGMASPSAAARKPFGAMTGRDNIPQAQPRVRLLNSPAEGVKEKERRKSRVLANLTGNNNIENVKDAGKSKVKNKAGGKDHVKERVREWEREKERLREMARLEELERERDEEVEEERERGMAEWKERMGAARETEKQDEETQDSDKENHRVVASPAVTSPSSSLMTESELDAEVCGSPVRSPNGSSLSVFKHNIRQSIDKTVRLYKNPAIAQLAGRTTSAQALSVDVGEDDVQSRRSHSERQSWEDDSLVHDANSSLPVVRHAVRTERVAADARMDRMTIWMRNVEKVVEDAQQNFASSSTHQLVPLPPLPLAPASRSVSTNRDTNRSSRLPRKILAANQIFTDNTADYTANSTGAFATVNTTTTTDISVPSEGPSRILPEIQLHTPSRQRRATVSGRSPEAPLNFDLDTGSPSKRREKSKSHGNLFQQHIAPISFLEAELNKPDVSVSLSSARLSEVIDSSLFVAPPVTARSLDLVRDTLIEQPETSFNDLTSSPFHVEPYPVRKSTSQIPDSPYQRRVEGVYDRFLMATSGVKRLGKGYQSDNVNPVGNIIDHAAGAHNSKRDGHRAFYSAKKPMPPPVSSEDMQRAMSVDELGVIVVAPAGKGLESSTNGMKDEIITGSLIKRIRAMVPGKPASRRLSRLAL